MCIFEVFTTIRGFLLESCAIDKENRILYASNLVTKVKNVVLKHLTSFV
jgi:hypothetical protein